MPNGAAREKANKTNPNSTTTKIGLNATMDARMHYGLLDEGC